MGHASPEPGTWRAPESRGAFGGFIGARNLVDLVRNSAPWLFDGSHRDAANVPESGPGRLCELAAHPLGWWRVLLAADRLESSEHPTPAQRTDYFALCLAAHFGSVATYVPTDVDAKIRHALWIDQTDRDELERMRDLALSIGSWDVSGVSRRIVTIEGFGPVSGHDGERLSVLCGGLIGMRHAGDEVGAARFEAAIDDELAREARAFDAMVRERGREATVIALAAILTHNAGDVVQSLASKSGRAHADLARVKYGDLARERFERYGGAYGRAAAVYRELCAAEGHRNYPLREVKLLRAHEDLLLPIPPFLDEWGETLARWPRWNTNERATVIAGVIDGCRRVSGQQAYYRALAGFDRAFPGGLWSRELDSSWTSSVRRELKDAELRRLVAVKRESFESSYKKRARQILSS